MLRPTNDLHACLVVPPRAFEMPGDPTSQQGRVLPHRLASATCGNGRSGRRALASHPRPSISVRPPPCASAICRLRTNPIPDPPGLVVKNGTKRFVVSGRPYPSSRTETSRYEPSLVQLIVTPPPVSSDASAAFLTMLISN